MGWFAYSFLFVLLISGFNYLSKKLLNHREVDPRLYGGLMNLGVGVLVLPIAVASGFAFRGTLTAFVLLVLIGIIITAAASLYYTGLKHTDLSESMVLEGVGVFFSLIFGWWFFAEQFTYLKVVAVLLVFGAIWLVSGLWERFRLNKFELYIVFSSALYSLGSMVDKYAVGYFNPMTYLSLGFLSVGVCLLLANAGRVKKNVHMFTPGFWKSLAVICSFIALAYAALYQAYAVGEISRVAITVQSQGVVTAILGIVFLKETKGLKRKVLALGIMAAGLYLVQL